jgi:hypothetical protein
MGAYPIEEGHANVVLALKQLSKRQGSAFPARSGISTRHSGNRKIDAPHLFCSAFRTIVKHLKGIDEKT